MSSDVAQSASSAGTVRFMRVREAGAAARLYGIVWVTLALFVVLSVASPAFLTQANLVNVLDQQSAVLIVGAAVTIAMVAGNFDMSLAGVFTLASVAAVQVQNATGSILIAVVAALGVGVACGAINGLIVTLGNVNSFIGTLATSFVFFGLSYIVSDQSILTPDDPGFADMARTKVLGITTASWVAIGFVAVLWFLLTRTRFGRHVFAVGTNAEAARLSGVRVNRVQLATFVLAGFAAAVAALLVTSRVMSAQATDDYNLIFVVITAVVVGGTSISGGEGAIWRTVLGVFFIAFVGNGFDLLGADPIYQRIMRGAIILGAVWLDARSRGRAPSLRGFRLRRPAATYRKRGEIE
jgi:ribose transport system permease protein